MLRIEKIIGTSSDGEVHQQLHRLEHAHAVDYLVLPRKDLARRRFRASTENGREVAVSLPRDETLFDGALLQLDQHEALIVKVEAESWLRLKVPDKSAALRVGFHAGNLHWRVKFDGNDLLVAIENELKTYMDRLDLLMKEGIVVPVVETVTDGQEQREHVHG